MAVAQSERVRLLEVFKKHTPVEHERSVRWVVPSLTHAYDLRRLILSDPDFPGIFGYPISTFGRLASEALGKSGICCPSVVSNTARRVLIRELLSRSDCFSAVRDMPHMPDALSSTIRSLKSAAVDPQTLRKAANLARLPNDSRCKIFNLVAFHESFQNELARLDLCEAEDLVKLAVQALVDNSAAWELKLLIISDFQRLTPDQQELVRLLSAAGSEVLLEAEAVSEAVDQPSDVTVLSAPTPGAEIQFAAREIRRLSREGVQFSDIGIIARDLRPFMSEISAVFKEYRIPLGPAFHPLVNHPVARRVLESPPDATRVLNDLSGDDPSDYAAARAIRRTLDEIAFTERLIGREFAPSEFTELVKSAVSSAGYRSGQEDGVAIVEAGSLGWKEFSVGFVVGLTDSRFPRHPREDPLLLDWEREALNPGLPNPLDLPADQQARERRLFKLAVGRVSDRLYLSRSAGIPSEFLDGIRGEEVIFDDLPPIESTENERDFVRSAVCGCCHGHLKSAAACNLLLGAGKIAPPDFDWLDSVEPSLPSRVADILGRRVAGG